MKSLPKILLSALLVVGVFAFLTMCEKQTDDQVAATTLAQNPETNDNSASDRSGSVTSCIECDLEWRFLCDQTKCDGGNYDKTLVWLFGNSFNESGGNGTCCTFYQTRVEWNGPLSVSEWLPVDPGILKSSVYPAMLANIGTSGCGDGQTKIFPEGIVPGGGRIPGTLKVQFRRKGDTAGTTLTQHNFPINPDLVSCVIDPAVINNREALGIPITIQNDCRVTSQYMVTPEVLGQFPNLCGEGEGGDR